MAPARWEILAAISHYMDLTHWALKLRNPVRIAATGPEYEPVSTPAWLIVEYDFPAAPSSPRSSFVEPPRRWPVLLVKVGRLKSQ